MRNGQLIREVKNFAKLPYTSIGCYPLFLLMADGDCLCAKCTRENFKLIARATRDSTREGWCAAAVDINYESQLYCCQCGGSIESAYGAPEEDP